MEVGDPPRQEEDKIEDFVTILGLAEEILKCAVRWHALRSWPEKYIDPSHPAISVKE